MQRPCDEALGAQLEEGYLKFKAWRLTASQGAQTPRSSSQPRARPTSWAPGQETPPASTQLTPKASNSNIPRQAAVNFVEPQAEPSNPDPGSGEQSQNTYRLFGPHSSSVVTYQDATTAWLLSDDSWTRMSYSMYKNFGQGGHFAGMKMTRGYVNPEKKAETKDEKTGEAKEGKTVPANDDNEVSQPDEQRPSTSETRRQNLTRQMSSLLEDPSQEDPAKQDEEMRRRDEREIEDDYREIEGEEQGREIEHLILVTHGIGQRLGLRLESVNFVHDVNTLRKTLKAVYADSPDLRALNAELGSDEHINSRIQVLPICWRHLLDFPKQSLKHNRQEHDLADTDVDDAEFPSLDDISVEGVTAVRNLITDLALDILLYQSPAYKDHITNIVVQECNRIHRLYLSRNPLFTGKVSLVGHSLGSAIVLDILCNEGASQRGEKRQREGHSTRLDFEVEDFYALGSPIGLFQMLKGRTIAAHARAEPRRWNMTSMDDPMLDNPAMPKPKPSIPTSPPSSDIASSIPNIKGNLANIFHTTDPISYRLEPLISPAMASLKPQPLPYTKRGIFGAPMNQGFSGISSRVSQSVSSMWSSMASSLLTRGLGYSGDEPTRVPTGQTAAKSSTPLSMGAGTNVSAGVIPTAPLPVEGTEIAKISDGRNDQFGSDGLVAGQGGHHPPTLIDAELETLYGDFQKRRRSVQNDTATRDLGAGAVGSPEWGEAEERAKKLRREEEKVRRLNSNGRVDYAIQEGVFDINLIAAIASHLSYWSDEDVSHFIISQLLSRHRVVRPRSPSGAGAKGQGTKQP